MQIKLELGPIRIANVLERGDRHDLSVVHAIESSAYDMWLISRRRDGKYEVHSVSTTEKVSNAVPTAVKTDGKRPQPKKEQKHVTKRK